MAFLEIDGIEVDVQTGNNPQEEMIPVGDKVRTFFGYLRVTYINHRRKWPFVSGPLTQAEFDTLMAKNLSIIPVTGDFFTGASINALVTFKSASYIDDNGTGFQRFLNILIEEQ